MATELENLARESRQAKAALGRTLKELQQELAHSADPRAWVKTHPWTTLGAALVAGFAATELLVLSPEQKAAKRVADLEAALRRKTEFEQDENHNGNGHAPESDEKLHHKVLGTLARSALQAAGPLLTTLLTALVPRPAEAAVAPPPDGRAAGGAPPPDGRAPGGAPPDTSDTPAEPR